MPEQPRDQATRTKDPRPPGVYHTRESAGAAEVDTQPMPVADLLPASTDRVTTAPIVQVCAQDSWTTPPVWIDTDRLLQGRQPPEAAHNTRAVRRLTLPHYAG